MAVTGRWKVGAKGRLVHQAWLVLVDLKIGLGDGNSFEDTQAAVEQFGWIVIDREMNIVFVCHTDFSRNSGIQMFHLANALADAGCECICIVPDSKATVNNCGTAKFVAYDYADSLSSELTFSNGRPPSLIHAWTPREPVRKISDQLKRRYNCPVLVHLEDNEDMITACRLGVDIAELKRLSDDELDRRLPYYVSHPRKSKAFLEHATGVTILIDKLRELVPDGLPVQMFWPSCDAELFRPTEPDAALRAQLGIAKDDIVLTYNGDVHEANRAEVRSLYLSVLFLNRMGHPARLIRLGSGIDCLDHAKGAVAPFVIDLGIRPNREMPRFLALATALVQPGKSDSFNDFRFPSKIPEFLAMQRPVVLPRANIGLHMTDGVDCLMLDAGHAGEIVTRVLALKRDPGLAKRLADGGRRFFEAHLSWRGAAAKVLDLYNKVLSDGRANATLRELSPSNNATQPASPRSHQTRKISE